MIIWIILKFLFEENEKLKVENKILNSQLNQFITQNNKQSLVLAQCQEAKNITDEILGV